MWLPLARPQLETWPSTQACALTGNVVHRLALDPLSHTSQGPEVLYGAVLLYLGFPLLYTPLRSAIWAPQAHPSLRICALAIPSPGMHFPNMSTRFSPLPPSCFLNVYLRSDAVPDVSFTYIPIALIVLVLVILRHSMR